MDPVKPGEDTAQLGPWPKGMNNRAAEHALGNDELRLAYNVDIDSQGNVFRRAGRTPILEQPGCHSAFGYGNHFLFVQNGTLYRGLPPAHAALRTGLSSLPMAYVEVNDVIHYSNGEITGRVLPSGQARPWGLPTPNPQPVVAAAGAGGLSAGRYQVATTWVDDTGEESGAEVSQSVDVLEGGGIALTGLPAAPSGFFITHRNVYASKTNDDQLYLVATIPAATSSYTVTAGQRGRALQTQLMLPFPPSTLLAYYNGVIYGAKDDVLWHSRALRYGLHNPRSDFIPFAKDVDVVLAVEDGLFVCADRTYWLGGKGPQEFSATAKLKFGAVRGTGVDIENSDKVAWFSKNGWMVGSAGGRIDQVTDTQVAPASYNSGVALFREERGIRQLVSALRAPTDNAFVATDYAEAEIIRRTA
jgi:hypothetical protein